jgi:hypothetical protein
MTAIVFQFGSDKIVYVGFKDGELFYTQDITAQTPVWEYLNDKLEGPGWTLGLAITGLYPVALRQGQGLYVTLGGFTASQKVFFIRYVPADGGLDGVHTVVNVTGAGLPNLPVDSLFVDTRNLDTLPIYLGNAAGVFASNGTNPPGARAWAVFGTGLPTVQVRDLQFYAPSSQLVAGTYGRGVYVITIPAAPAGNPPGQQGAIEGQPDNFIVVGTYTDPSQPPPHNVATVNWGDGTAPVTFPVFPNYPTQGTYSVIGSHTFADEGLYNVTASVDNGLILTTTVVVEDADITASPPSPPISVSEGSLISNQPVATFTDANPASTVADFSSYIDWNDGTMSYGTIVALNGNYTVLGSHTYSNAGSFPVEVAIYDDGGSFATTTSTATINGAISATSVPISATEGVSPGGIPPTIAFFTDTAPNLSSYSVSINYGDGHLGAGIVYSGGGNTFFVDGTNTYTEEGT